MFVGTFVLVYPQTRLLQHAWHIGFHIAEDSSLCDVLTVQTGEGKEERCWEGDTSLHTHLPFSSSMKMQIKSQTCRHTELGRSQELPLRSAVPKGITRHPPGNCQLGNVIPLLVTDTEQLCFAEGEQRLALSGNDGGPAEAWAPLPPHKPLLLSACQTPRRLITLEKWL